MAGALANKKNVQDAVNDPTSDGQQYWDFIRSITQDTNGKIYPVKSHVPYGWTTQAGIVTTYDNVDYDEDRSHVVNRLCAYNQLFIKTYKVTVSYSGTEFNNSSGFYTTVSVPVNINNDNLVSFLAITGDVATTRGLRFECCFVGNGIAYLKIVCTAYITSPFSITYTFKYV